MRMRSLVLAVLMPGSFICSPVAAAEFPSPPPEVAEVVRADRYPMPEVTFPNGVKGIPGITYLEPVGYRRLTLDLYLPPGTVARPATGFPLVIYIHGGDWMGGDSHSGAPFVDFPGVLAALSARGYVVASIEYRLSGEAKFPAQAQDVKSAIRWLRSRASEFGIDPARAVTWGVSAGGHLAALAAVSCNSAVLEPLQPLSADGRSVTTPTRNISDCVQGSVAWYGVFNMATIAAQARQDKARSRDHSIAPEWQLLCCFGSSCDADRMAAASPVTYVDRNDPPMLLIVGSEDTTVPYHQTLEMADRLKAAGVKYELMVLPGINHSFIGKTPRETRDANLKALDTTFKFIDNTLGTAAEAAAGIGTAAPAARPKGGTDGSASGETLRGTDRLAEGSGPGGK